MEVTLWPVAKIIPYARNARKISAKAVDKVASSIKEFGWRQPIVVDKEGVIIAGHTRLLAAHKLCMEQAPVHVAQNLTPAQVKAYRLMDNRSNDEAEWDMDLLGPELLDLQGLDLDLSLTGFDDSELARYLNGDGVNDPFSEWGEQGSVPFEQPDVSAFRSIKVHFADQASVDDFSRRIGQPLNAGTKFIWHPLQKHADYTQKTYVASE